jgi:DNA adenine methylase
VFVIVPLACRGLVRPPLKYHGGKYPIASWIVSHFPEHEEYREPFLGGGSVFLSKTPGTPSLLSDDEPEVVAVWAAIKARHEDLSRLLRFTSYSRAAWEDAKNHLESKDPVLVAAARMIRSRWSRGGTGKSFGASTRLRGGQDEYRNSWETFLADDLPAIIARLADATVEFMDYREAMETAHSGTLVYCDPPYHPETRTVTRAYTNEFSAADHAELLDIVRSSPAKIALSGYRHPSYDAALADWNRHDREVPNHSSQRATKSRRVESLWCNF